MTEQIPARARSVDDILGVGQYAPQLDLANEVRRASSVIGRYSGGDSINGAEFARAHAGKLIYVPERKQWMEFDGFRWVPTNGLKHMQAWAARRVVDHPEREKLLKLELKERRAAMKAAVELLSKVYLQKNALECAAVHPTICKHAWELDTDPWRLACKNGVINLQGGFVLNAHAPDYITKIAGTYFDESAKSALWDNFLETAIPDQEMREFVQRLVGYSLTGIVSEEIFVFIYGRGATGKSTFANVLEAMMGQHAVTVSKDLVIKSKHSTESRHQINRLCGARMASLNETASGDVFDDQLVKMITSREAIPAREHHKAAFDFSPSHKLWMRGNHLPGSHDAGTGFWRRIIPIAFDNVIPPDRRVADLDRRLIDEALPAVLAWAVEGCLEWQDGGLRIPGSIVKAREQYRYSTDLFSQWLDECTKRDPSGKVKTADLFDSYSTYANASGASAGYIRTFSEELARRGFARDASTKNGRRFVGLRLLASREFEDV